MEVVRALITMTAVVLAFGLPCTDAAAADWREFRGTARSGVSPETDLLESWPESGPKQLWKRELGDGFSGVSVVGGRLYTMFSEGQSEEGTEFAGAFDTDSGKELWRVEVGKILVDEYGDGPRSTPAVAGDTAYFLGSRGRLVALATADGALKWELDLTKDFAAKTPRWGFTSSPLVDGDILIVEVGGGEGKAFAALDRGTGAVRWKIHDGEAGYNSPLVASLHGARQILFMDSKGTLVSFDFKGKQLWSYTFSEEGGGIPMPVLVSPDGIFLSGAGKPGAVLIRVTEAGSVEEVWKNPRMRNNWSNSLFIDGNIYGFDNAALKCISAETGEQLWRQRGFGKGSLIAADGMLYILGDDGRLVLAKASSKAYEEVGSVQAVEGKSWTAPSIADGRIYVRNLEQMACFGIAN